MVELVLNNLDNYMHNAHICVHFSQNTKNKDHFVHSGPEPLGISLQYLRGKVFIYFEIKHCTNIGTGRRIFVKTTQLSIYIAAFKLLLSSVMTHHPYSLS